MFKTKPVLIIFTAIFIFCFSCKTVEPKIPQFDSEISEEESDKLYNEYKLEKRGNALFYMYFIQGENEGKINNKSIEILFDQSNKEVKSLYMKSRSLLRACNILITVGYCCCEPLAGLLLIKEYYTSSYTVFGVEGGLILSSIITGIISDHKYEDTIFAYNEYLEEVLY